MNVVSIMAHQDDEMGCLGTMLKCRARGDALAFIVLTDGSKGFMQRPDIEQAEAARIRGEEMGTLAAELGARYLCMGEPDEFLYDTAALRMKLIEAIRSTDADLVFTHCARDYNQDHMTTSALVLHCAMQSCLPVLPTASTPLAAHPAVFHTLPHVPVAFPATHFVDVGEFEAEKVRLLSLHRSQEEAMRMAVGTGFEALCGRSDAYWGQQAGCAFAEPFTPMRSRGAIKAHPVLP